MARTSPELWPQLTSINKEGFLGATVGVVSNANDEHITSLVTLSNLDDFRNVRVARGNVPHKLLNLWGKERTNDSER